MPFSARRLRPILPSLVLLGIVAGCGGGQPYVLTDFRQHQTGRVEVCYDDHKTPLDQVTVLANTVCDQYDRMARFQISQRNQCNWRTPDIALFYCVARPGEHPAPIAPQKAPLRGGS